MFVRGLCLGVILVLGAGCGKLPPNKITGSKIWGKVTFQKQPVNSGVISFIPVDPALSPTAVEITEGGSFELPVPPGRYKVHIVSRHALAAATDKMPPGATVHPLTKDGISTEITESKELNFDLK